MTPPDDAPSSTRPRQGALTVICGPMFAGKTTELLRRLALARAAGRQALAVKPARDTRYSEGHLVTHTGTRTEALRVGTLGELPARAAPADFIAIDEIHFFGAEAVEPIARLRSRGAEIVVAGCDLDHFGEVFAPFDALIPAASELVRLSGACARCGAASTHSERLVAATDRIIVGGAGEFVATCAACFRPSRRS